MRYVCVENDKKLSCDNDFLRGEQELFQSRYDKLEGGRIRIKAEHDRLDLGKD